MARSRKRHPVTGICCGSDTWAKRQAAKRLRLANRALLRRHGGEAVFREPEEIADPWWWPRDGRCRWNSPTITRHWGEDQAWAWRK